MNYTEHSASALSQGNLHPRTEQAFLVVVNEEGQHSLWPATLTVPPGWRQQGPAMRKDACLAAIMAAWPDIAPASVRDASLAAARRDAAGPGTDVGQAPAHGRDPRFVHEMFDEQAARRPDCAAVVSAAGDVTYRQLSQSANRLAHHLQGLGVVPETLVGVGLERGAGTTRCLLAILKAGGAYLPLDPSLPGIRLAQMREEAGVRLVLTDSKNARAFTGSGATLILTDEFAANMTAHPVTAPVVSLRAANIAYAIWTSGSTGHPKAVAVSHGSLGCLCRDAIRAYGLSAQDRVLQMASLGFDTSLEQMLVTLLSGAALVLPGASPVAPGDLLRYLAEQRVSVADLTPAYWHQVLTAAADGQLGSLRLMITGGDQANAADCRAALRRAPGARLLNAYGLTETTITSALFEATDQLLASQPGAPVPAGTPLPHAQILVLDDELKVLPAGAAGEIYIGGGGVARGYLGRPDLTAELFLPNPSAAVPGARMYRTGDRGRWRPDGSLEVIGRMDRQVKISGFRVEPAEIESVIETHPGIRQAAVIARELGGGDKQVAAYYTVRRGAPPGPPSAENLRRLLSAHLPSFMIPAVFVMLDRMPLTPRGEIDRQALRVTAVPAVAHPQDMPNTALQAGMSHLWAEVLRVRQVSLDDDFFRLGGNSLLAAEMLARARVMFGIDATQVRPLTRRLLLDPTLRSFADATHGARAGTLVADGGGTRIDFTREAALNVPIRLDAGPAPDWQRPREILLTGATGFFGVHLLRELLTSTDARVHCLVRAPDPAAGMARIAQAAGRYQLGHLPLDRVIPLAGDLTQPNLGLPQDTFEQLARGVDVIHHAGALVNFIYPYSELRAANVAGTRELVRLAGLYRGIPMHYVSTAAVLAGFGRAGVREVTEETPLAYAEYLSIGYVESNFVAEELLRNAALRGLPVAIYRPLDIVGDHRSGVWNTATEMYAMIRFITDTGIAPDVDLPLDFAPADICAAAISYIAAHVTAGGDTYHLASPQHALIGSLTARLRKFGFTIQEVPYQEWVGRLLSYAARHPDHPMTPFIPLFFDRSPGSDMTVAEMYLAHNFPSYGRANTERALRDSGIVFPPVDEKLLDLHIAHLVSAGYLTDPRGALPANRAFSGQEAPHGSQLLPGLGVVRHVIGSRRLPARLLRRSAPGQPARCVQAGNSAVPGSRRVFAEH
jgi:amino acid adenylation domain-containing protein/thioester reductase-like protein